MCLGVAPPPLSSIACPLHCLYLWGKKNTQSFYENVCRDASCQLARILLCLLFGPTIPTWFFNLFNCFLYLYKVLNVKSTQLSLGIGWLGCTLGIGWFSAINPW